MIVLGIETSTPQSSVALGTEREILASTVLSGKGHQEAVIPALQHLLRWTGIELSRVGGVAVGLGPGQFTGLRVGVETGKALAQVLGVPIVGLCSLDALAYAVRHSPRLIGAVIDARRGEVFFAMYRSAPGGVVRATEYAVGSPDNLAADLQALGRDVLLVGNGAILYRRRFEEVGGKVEFASPAQAHPQASALVELSVPRFIREESDRLFEVVPFYLRKSDAEIAWDKRARGA
ncbi:MAG: tRNA (adenosine(37)-N6)-threonylcarbamoyltransferase complex dimerization subunit type 1 TsaB [Actinobacteria bacterium]|nr:tRNA (adenosine(37)-N6)-threonylcarbamoyltransferase complex dimerization subunit type 1 TsaB [Actinomycetota bacterium]